MGLEIYQLRNNHLNSINKILNFLKNEHKFQFQLEMKLLDKNFNISLNFEKYLKILHDSRISDKQFGGTKIDLIDQI